MGFLMLFTACTSDSDTDKDEEKPVITVQYTDGFPQACATLQRGETYSFRARVTDNDALAAYSLNIHHNFDHHTHDDQEEQCTLEDVKEATNPFMYMENFSIENAPQSYEVVQEITIPNDIDTGDYHCAFSVTDQTGWQSRTSIGIKIIE